MRSPNFLSRRAVHDRTGVTSDDRISHWVFAILAAIIFEGAARKWVLPFELHPVAFLSKDVLAIAFVIRYPLALRAGPARWVRDIAVFVSVLLIPSLALGLMGTAQSAVVNYKNAVVWPLFAAHLAMRLDQNVISRLTSRLALVAAGMAALGLLQFRSPQDSWVNRDAWTAAGFSTTSVLFGVGDGVRASGTFSFISGMSLFAIFVFQFALWRFLNASGRRERNYSALGLVGSLVCGFTCGSRSTVVTYALTLLLALLTSLRARQVFRFVPVLIAGTLVLVYAFPDVTAAFTGRWEIAGDSTVDRMTGQATRVNYFDILADGPFGVGLGQKTGYGVAAGFAKMGEQYETGYDDGGSNAVLEGGVLGLFALTLTALLCLQLFLRGYQSKDRTFRSSWACLGAVSLYFIAAGRWYDHTGSAFMWLSVAIWLSTDPEIVKLRERLRGETPQARRLNRRSGDLLPSACGL